MKFGIVVFPGSNCDHDAYHVTKHLLGEDAVFLWHKENDLQNIDCVILPGGFSYGDYLRTGSIARFSPIMKEVIQFADRGGFVLGICNGFQILLESGLLPGAMLKNSSLTFVCKHVNLLVKNNSTVFTSRYSENQILRIPVAHGDGNYFTDDETLKRLEDNNQILFQYCNDQGLITNESNPNGSLKNIAGIVNERGNICGMMPHPERCAEAILGSVDGLGIFKSLVTHLSQSERIAA